MQRSAIWNLHGGRQSRKRACMRGRRSAKNTTLPHCGSRGSTWCSVLSVMCRDKRRIWIFRTGFMRRQGMAAGTTRIMGKATLQTMPMPCSGLRIIVCFVRWRSFWVGIILFPMWSWAALDTGASGTSKAKMGWYPCRTRRSGTNMPRIILRPFLRRSC